MDADSLIIGDFIKAVELGSTLPANPTWRIKSVEIERLPDLKKPGKEKDKGVVFFVDHERGWVMNRTNVECLKALFGRETAGWIGKRVTLGQEPTKTGPGVRIIGSPEITQDVVAEWTPPRQKKVSKRMVPTGNARANTGTKPADHPHPAAALIADVAALLNVTDEVVVKFFAAVPIVVKDCNAADVAAILADLAPGGPLREQFEAGPGEVAGE